MALELQVFHVAVVSHTDYYHHGNNVWKSGWGPELRTTTHQCTKTRLNEVIGLPQEVLAKLSKEQLTYCDGNFLSFQPILEALHLDKMSVTVGECILRPQEFIKRIHTSLKVSIKLTLSSSRVFKIRVSPDA